MVHKEPCGAGFKPDLLQAHLFSAHGPLSTAPNRSLKELYELWLYYKLFSNIRVIILFTVIKLYFYRIYLVTGLKTFNKCLF